MLSDGARRGIRWAHPAVLRALCVADFENLVSLFFFLWFSLFTLSYGTLGLALWSISRLSATTSRMAIHGHGTAHLGGTVGRMRTCRGLESYLDSGMMPILSCLPAPFQGARPSIYLAQVQLSLAHGSTAVFCFVLITK